MNKSGFLVLSSLLMAPFCVQAQAPDPSSIAPMIINGDHAEVSNYPYFASLYFDRISETGYYGNICGATVYNQNYILTAAHCVDQSNDGYQNLFLKVAVGVQYEKAGVQGGYNSNQAIAISEIYRHSEFKNDADLLFPNDIAVVKLASPIPTSLVDPRDYIEANLITQEQLNANTYRNANANLRIIGHGKSTPIGGGLVVDDAEQLEKADVRYTDVCNKHGQTGSKKICIISDLEQDGGLQRYRSACSGDSGGPLLWLDGANYQQVGIASYAAKDCGSQFDPKGTPYNYASAYTDLFSYLPWIKEVVTKSKPHEPSFVVTESAKAVFKSSATGSEGGSLGLFGLVSLILFAGIRRQHGL